MQKLPRLTSEFLLSIDSLLQFAISNTKQRRSIRHLSRISVVLVGVFCGGTKAESDGVATSNSPPRENENWAERVEEARKRAHEFVEQAKAKKQYAPVSDAEKNAAEVQRALDDPTLMPGDLISDGRGFLKPKFKISD